MPLPATDGLDLQDTIYALSSGRPPAGIAIVRISGSYASDSLKALAGDIPKARQASVRALKNPDGLLLDEALVLWFPGPASSTGEDVAELHLHGGRAIVDIVLTTLRGFGLREAEPGEFTRRALLNGRLNLSEAEGLADLLAAETEAQRREALQRADGVLGRLLDTWSRALIDIAAALEAAIDYDGEEDVQASARAGIDAKIDLLVTEIDHALSLPHAERLRDGIRVVIAGPPNSGKSTLLNALLGRDAAIVTPIAGTTRDIIEAPVSIGGLPFMLIDTAGLRDTDDPVEAIGIDRARRVASAADILISLDPATDGGTNSLAIAAKADLGNPRSKAMPVSAATGRGMPGLVSELMRRARALVPAGDEVALDRRYREGLCLIRSELIWAAKAEDELIIAEHVRLARRGVDRLTGQADIEEVLDALFSRFCLGK